MGTLTKTAKQLRRKNYEENFVERKVRIRNEIRKYQEKYSTPQLVVKGKKAGFTNILLGRKKAKRIRAILKRKRKGLKPYPLKRK